MLDSRRILKKWVDNFAKCPLVHRDSRAFDRGMASQLFYGKKDASYNDEYPHGFERFYLSSYALPPDEKIETSLRFLHFVGIRLDTEIVKTYLADHPEDHPKILKKTYYILKTFAHTSELDITRPFRDFGDIDYLLRIQTKQAQLSIFETSLPEIYGRRTVPEGYGDDPLVAKFLNEIESSSASFFISGKAGTGKSTFIHYFTQNTKKTVFLMAFTGIAAMNVGGVTIHSFFKFPLQPMLPGDEAIPIFGENDYRRKLIEGSDTIVIDEVSMLRADLVAAIDHSLRSNGGHPDKPFGGKQMLFVGDLFQLPPVISDGDAVERFLFSELYKSPYFFDSDAYRRLKPKLLEFTHSHRQAEDLDFVTLLDRVRNCDVDDELLETLNQRVDPTFVPRPGDFTVTLTTSNAIANMENGKRLAEIASPLYEFPASIQGAFDTGTTLTAGVLQLKAGAQVMFTKNDGTGRRRWVNGTLGKVDFVAHDVIDVSLADGTIHKLEREVWENRGYRYDINSFSFLV
jgi:ATP-dependent DNA helicase PIF1